MKEENPASAPNQKPHTPEYVGLVGEDAAAWELLGHAERVLGEFGLKPDKRLFPRPHQEGEVASYARDALERGSHFVIAASPDETLPRCLAAAGLTVFRVPQAGAGREGLSLLSFPEPASSSSAPSFATMAIGEAGAKNAALLVVAACALSDERLRKALREFRSLQTAAVLSATLPE